MEFDLNDEERALRDAARRYLEREAPVSYARAMMEDGAGYREEIWRAMASMGWMGLPFPESDGGVGQGFIALAIVLEEMGRVVLPGPFLPTVLAGLAVLDSDVHRKELLPAICSGEVVAAVALGSEFAIGAATASRFVIETGTELHLAARDWVAVSPVEWMDATRRASLVRLERGEPIGPADRLRDRAAVAISAEMVGAASRVTELAVEYAKTRVQFGKPIGSFQAVKHRAADMALDVESMRNAVWYAAWALERDDPGAALAASTAKAVVSDGARRVAASGIQIHGGIGFTWEHDMHLYFKRINASASLFGDATFHRDRAARLLAGRYT